MNCPVTFPHGPLRAMPPPTTSDLGCGFVTDPFTNVFSITVWMVVTPVSFLDHRGWRPLTNSRRSFVK